MYVPHSIGEANVIAWVVLNKTHLRTGNTQHFVNGNLVAAFYGLAICRYATEEGVYLFYCNKKWEATTDTWHENLEDALEQAEFEYTNLQENWVFIK